MLEYLDLLGTNRIHSLFKLQQVCNWTRGLISSFLIAFREGVEAALDVGIVLVYLGRTGRSRLVRFVWIGAGLAAALSLAAAVA